MSKYQFYLCVDGKGKDDYVTVRRICAFDEHTWFSFPEEHHKLSNHKELAKLTPIKSAVAVLKSRGQYCTVNVSLTDSVKKLYEDEAGNFIFKNFFLGETNFSSQSQLSYDLKLDELVCCLSKPHPESIKDILKYFSVEKFSTKNKNVEAWCYRFQKESSRFDLSGQKQIEIFKSYLDSSMDDWFSVNQRRLPSDADWSIWKKQLLSTFSDHSWKPIKYAFNYKFLNGSLITYALRKQKLLLELDIDLSDLIILYLIVVGLPLHIQNSLNRYSVNSIEKLHKKLKKFEGEKRNL